MKPNPASPLPEPLGGPEKAPSAPVEWLAEDYRECEDCGVLHNESYCPRCEEMS